MAKQVVQDINFFAKKILPSSNTEVYEEAARWSKDHGHAGSNMITRMREKALKLGFVDAKNINSNSPDGSAFNNHNVLVHPAGFTLKFTEHYGVTAWENRFSATLIDNNAEQ